MKRALGTRDQCPSTGLSVCFLGWDRGILRQQSVMPKLKVILLKPSKYGIDGYVERFRWGFMPNATLPYMRSMTPRKIDGWDVEVCAIDEYVQTDLSYLRHLEASSDPTLLALIGVQSHQFHRSLDLAAYALANGVRHCVIGGPHPMTCDTTIMQNCGVSFSLSEAEITWDEILRDAIQGSLKPVYRGGSRWQSELTSPVVTPPAQDEESSPFLVETLHGSRLVTQPSSSISSTSSPQSSTRA